MVKPLDEYDRKRRFDSTPEPAGARNARGRRGRGGLQFVVQKHDARTFRGLGRIICTGSESFCTKRVFRKNDINDKGLFGSPR